MAADLLTQRDIVGHVVSTVYRSEWDEDPDGYAGCAVFVELKNGCMFELQANGPISRTDVPPTSLFDVSDDVARRCRNKMIKDVVVSDYWPGIGLLFQDGDLLFIGETLPRRVGPCVSNNRTSSDFRVTNVRSYWR